MPKQKQYQKEWYARIKSDPIAHAKLKEKTRQQWLKRKARLQQSESLRQNLSVRRKKRRHKHVFHKLAEYLRKYRGGNITKGDLWKICKKQRCKCALTGRPLTNENISLDHIIPISRGGENVKENLQLVTKDVNYAKHKLLDSEFILLCQDVVANNNR